MSLYNITTGVTAGPNVNVDRAEIIGKDMVAKMVDQNVFEFSFQCKNQATNMQTTGVIIGEETINIDPQVLAQRLIAVKDHHEYSAELFKYMSYVAIPQHCLTDVGYQERQTSHR